MGAFLLVAAFLILCLPNHWEDHLILRFGNYRYLIFLPIYLILLTAVWWTNALLVPLTAILLILATWLDLHRATQLHHHRPE